MEEAPTSRALLPHLNTPRAAKTSPVRAPGPPSGTATRQRAPAAAPLLPCPPLGALTSVPARRPGQAEAPPHPGGRSRLAGAAGTERRAAVVPRCLPARHLPPLSRQRQRRRAAPGSAWGGGARGRRSVPPAAKRSRERRDAARAGPPEPPRSSLTRCRPCGGRF